MKLQLPPPSNWQDFEDLCLAVWRELWRDPNAQKNGRLGQPQSGVDVFGHRQLHGNEIWFGVQCKLRDQLLGGQLTEAEIRSEIAKAEAFTPKLDDLTFATTAPRDSRLQEFARPLKFKGECTFGVQIYSWDDISDFVQARPALFAALYGSAISDASQAVRVTSDAITTIVKGRNPIAECYAMFDSEIVRSRMSDVLRVELCNVVTELCLNALEHGKASRCQVRLTHQGIEIIDNGLPFNPLSYVSNTHQKAVGLIYVKHFLAKWSHIAGASYAREEQNNVLRVAFSLALASEEFNKECLIVPRSAGRFQDCYSIEEYVNIPADCVEYRFDVPAGAFNPSSLNEFIDALFAYIPKSARVVVTFSRLDALMESTLLLEVSTGLYDAAKLIIGKSRTGL